LSLFENSKNSLSANYSSNQAVSDPEIYFGDFDSISRPNIVITSSINYRLFQTWIFTNFVPLFSLDLSFSNNLQISSLKVTLPSVLTKIVRLALKESETSNIAQESTLYNLLILALKSSQFLSAPPFDLLILFVEHFLKKLNVNYNIYRAGATGGTNSIQEYSWMPRNSSRWLQT